MTFNIYPYKPGSVSAKELAAALGVKRIKHRNSKFKGRAGKTVLNWGASELPEEVMKCNVLNKPVAVKAASNKRDFFELIKAYNKDAEAPVRVPEHTLDEDDALAWALEGKAVVARQKLTGNSGAGIVMVNKPNDMVKAPLYTLYVKKKDEYRIHILNGKVFDIQRKARNRDIEDENVNWQVRNHENGFIFQRNDFDTPQDVIGQSLRAVEAVGLDFGAVDVAYNAKEGKAYVLEVNTAPGLVGTTLENYTEAFAALV